MTKPMKLAKQLVVTCCDAPELLEPDERSMMLRSFIETGVVRALIFSVSLWRNDNGGLHLNNLVDEMVGIIALVGDCAAWLKTIDQ